MCALVACELGRSLRGAPCDWGGRKIGNGPTMTAQRKDARGRCLNGGNRSLAAGESKMDVFRRYRFCFAVENSIAHDYVSEKLWDAFAAGCVPIYYVRPPRCFQYR